MEMCNVLVVDDESFVVHSVSALLQSQKEWNLEVRRAYSGEEALRQIHAGRVDILLTDIRMPGLSGLELARSTGLLWPECVRILLTAYEDFTFAREAIRLGVDSFVLKTESDEALLEAFAQAIRLFEKRRMQALRTLPDQISCPERNASCLQILVSVRQDEQQTRAILRMMGAELEEMCLLTVDIAQEEQAGSLEWLIREQLPQRAELLAVCRYEGRLCMLARPCAPLSSLQGALELAQAHYTAISGAAFSAVIGLISEKAWNVQAEFGRAQAFFDTAGGESGFIYSMPAPHQQEQALHTLLDKPTEYIQQHLGEELSLSALSEVVGYSPAYLSRLFHDKMGCPLSAYIGEAKIAQVKLMMRDPELSVSAIAAACGFNSRSYFNRYVKRMTGYNPQQLRDRILAGK